jgi:pimeloyl-ACP methyl ester carboxylesterase
VVVLTSTERLVETNGVQLRVIDTGDRDAPVVVLAHGFPELAYSSRHQIPDRFAGIAGLSVPPVPPPNPPTIDVPSLFVGGAATDPTPAYTPRHRVRDVVSGDYREVMIAGAGHWLQQERPAEVNTILLDFLSRLEL